MIFLYIILNIFICSNIFMISFSCWHSEPDSIRMHFATNIINIYYVHFKGTHTYYSVCHMLVKYFSKLLYTSHVIDGK